MLEHKLFKLLHVLTLRELPEVERHLAVPIFNPTKDVLRLFSQACRFYPKFDDPKLTKEWLHKRLYGKQPFNDGKMRKLMTQLTQGVEQYLIYSELQKSEELKAKLLARSLGERSNYGLFIEVVESRLKKLDEQAGRGRDYFRESFELSESLYYHPGSAKANKRSDYFNQAIDCLEHYFTLVMLQNEANNVIKTRLERQQGPSAYLDLALQIATTQHFASSEVIQFFRHIIFLLKGEAAENIEQLRETAFKIFAHLSRFEKDFAINLLRNYAVPMSNEGSMPHRRFMFELYKLELGWGFFANTISSVTFMNIATVGLSVGDINWVKYFIGNYSGYLVDDEKEITLNFCNGLWYYHKGLIENQMEDFLDALKFMSCIPIRTGPKYEVRVRPYLLRIHFELFERGKESFDELLNHARNFGRHLNGSEEYAEPIRKSHLNFLRYYKTLARLFANPDMERHSVVRFIEKLNQGVVPIAHKHWLVEKARGLAIFG